MLGTNYSPLGIIDYYDNDDGNGDGAMGSGMAGYDDDDDGNGQ
jgi:hypothetical protein